MKRSNFILSLFCIFSLLLLITACGSGAFTSTGNRGGSTPSNPSITTTSVPGATVGSAYAATLQATGGTRPYSWSLKSGALPEGLSLSAAGTISGTPTTAGNDDSLVFEVTDADQNSASSGDLSLRVNPNSNSAGGSGTSPTMFSVAGNVSGLVGSGLVFQNNGTDNLPVSTGGPFAFPTKLASGSAYSVTVFVQPTSPTQTCSVANGSGLLTANAAVQVTCTTATYAVGGSVQGLVGTGLVLQDNLGDNLPISVNGFFIFSASISGGSPYNVTVLTQPISPAQTCSLTSATGTANANVTTVHVICTNNNPAGQWMWVGGSDLPDQLGTYGTLLTSSAANAPGSRYNAMSWNDAAGNLWLFGGTGYDSETPELGDLNDLWKYSAGQWTWMSGSNLSWQTGVYGTQGVAAPNNTPGGLRSSAAWVDAAGNFWLFGGNGPDSTGTGSFLNQLWEYSNGEWIWVSGSKLGNQPATYGTQGTASTDNMPSSRAGAVEWTDAAGNFWIFGGFGVTASGMGNLNDLWKYSAGEWTWMGGSNVTDQAGVYGTQGLADSSNMPGTRNSAMGWVDVPGNFWLFGGAGSDSRGTQGDLNDMWEYSNGQWTWISGSNLQGQLGTYGTQGLATSTNLPGARDSSVTLTDASGNFWLFAGNGFASTTVRGGLNDIWKFSAGQWTWMGGSNGVNEAGIYGVLGTSSPDNIPGGRTGSVGRIDAAGGIWIFGGSLGFSTPFNDLWMYQP